MQDRPQCDRFRVAKDSQGHGQQRKTRWDRTKKDKDRTRQDKIDRAVQGGLGQVRSAGRV